MCARMGPTKRNPPTGEPVRELVELQYNGLPAFVGAKIGNLSQFAYKAPKSPENGQKRDVSGLYRYGV